MDPPRTAQCIVCSAVVVTLILLFGFLAYFLYIYVYGYAVDEFRSKILSLCMCSFNYPFIDYELEIFSL